ncbi:hypothetical protein C1J02_15220 [Sulfitobacter sp. SK011]|nr:hypothetical protein C1J02_15220 [Sulfitobacter sp. SK011]
MLRRERSDDEASPDITVPGGVAALSADLVATRFGATLPYLTTSVSAVPVFAVALFSMRIQIGTINA